MSTIPPRFMQELRDRLTLSEVIGRRIKVLRAGREFKACCPFHHEKSPSFYINDDKQFYHCFGCQAHGDVVEFTMRHDNLTFIEAVESLATQAGMQVPQATPQDIERSKKEKDLYTLMDEATQWFQKRLYESAHVDALTYMRNRGVSEEMLSGFRVGFAPADGNALPRYLKAQGFTDSQMIEAGVARASTRGGEPYSFFRDRVMFPVPDRRGRVVAFGGRVLPEHLRPLAPGESKPPKYINSSETTLFRKGEMLFGEPQARQAAHDGLPLIVVEGYLDVIAAFSAGYRGALAPMGTALTEAQVTALWKMIPADEKVPVLCFDGDDAGRRAASKAMERILPLLQPNHSVRIAFLPNGQDPDSLIKAQGTSAFNAVIDAAMPLVDFIWLHHTAGKTFDTPEAQAGLNQTLEKDVLNIPDRNVQHYYREALRQKLRASFTPPRKTPYSPGAGPRKPVKGPEHSVPMRRPGFADVQTGVLVLLACALNHPGIFDSIEDELGQLDIPEPRMAALRQAIIQALGQNPVLDSAGLRHHLEQEGFAVEMVAVLSDLVYTHAGFARPDADSSFVRIGWKDTLAFLNRRTLQRELKAAEQALNNDFSDENERRIIALRRSGRSLHGTPDEAGEG